MKTDLEELASLYALGVLGRAEKVRAERLISSNASFRKLVDDLQEVVADVALTSSPVAGKPSESVREGVLRRTERLQTGSVLEGLLLRPEEALVITDRSGRIEWVNEAFTRLCGYELEELRGRKPGRVLQGELTDPGVARRMSAAIHDETFCSEDILNYHKDGNPYWVSVTISPILDAGHRARGFVAIERALEGRAIPRSLSVGA